MSLAKLKKVKSHRVLGVDASTNSLAFCVFDGNSVVSYGEVFFEGSDIYEKILDAKRKVRAIRAAGEWSADFMVLESAVMVRSAATGIKMAYVFGSIIGEILDDDMEVMEVHPITWQSFIGNKNFTKAEKQAVKDEFPDKSENWRKAQIRKMRKQRTIDFAKSIGVMTDSDNVADAVGIAWYATKTLMDQS